MPFDPSLQRPPYLFLELYITKFPVVWDPHNSILTAFEEQQKILIKTN